MVLLASWRFNRLQRGALLTSHSAMAFSSSVTSPIGGSTVISACRVPGAQVLQHARQVLLQVSALRQEQRRDGDPVVAVPDQLRHAIAERRLHQFEEREFNGEIGAARRDRLTDRAERLAPLRVARAVGEQDQC